ncbi:MAG TPA: VOC family protein [Candidatus Acidoferrales bacterium]|jgi:catechol 2,3-dioxygenase-like lactoylglutathione lyase family enzyme|nr:VOC family protein [Candidatus Acidoferrales bacterium]
MAVVTIFVANMDRAVQFYTEVLGLKLVYRFGNDWASLKTDDGMNVGLHPASKESPAGRKGSITIGFEVSESMRKVVAAMKERGVKFVSPIVDDKEIKAAHFEDPDGNEMYFVEAQQQWKDYDRTKATV